MLEKIAIFLLGAGTSGIAWLIQRWLRKDHVGEEIQRRTDTANLVVLLRREGLTMGEVEVALGRIDPSRSLPAQTKIDPEEEREIAAIEQADSQQDLNIAQGLRYERLERRMNSVLADLLARMDDRNAQLLRASQEKWLEYRAVMVDLAGAPFEGGSMQPFVESGEGSAITQRRIRELEEQLESRRDMVALLTD